MGASDKSDSYILPPSFGRRHVELLGTKDASLGQIRAISWTKSSGRLVSKSKLPVALTPRNDATSRQCQYII